MSDKSKKILIISIIVIAIIAVIVVICCNSNVEKIQNNTEELIELYKNQGLTDNVYLSQQDLQSIKKQIKNLEKSKLRLEEMNKAISEIQKEIDYINKDARPKFIRYCKIYIDMKKEQAR